MTRLPDPVPVPRTGASLAAAAALEGLVARVAAASGLPVTLARGGGDGGGGGSCKRPAASGNILTSKAAAPCAPASMVAETCALWMELVSQKLQAMG